jgi:uncharacterized protein (TIGR02246 family)
MKQSFLASRAVLAVLLLLPLQANGAQQKNAGEEAIRAQAKEFVAAYNRGDAKAIAALWTEDRDYELGASTVKGREAIARLYEEHFKTHAGSKMDVEIESIRLLAPTVAIEQGTAAVGGSANSAPTASAYTAVHAKQKDGKWRMAMVRESELPALVREDLKELSWLIGNWTAQGDAAAVDVTYEWTANNNFIRGETKVRAKAVDKPANGGTQIIGRDPRSGQIVSWYFNADGGHGFGTWIKDGSRWLIESQGTTVDGESTAATNVMYRADDNVMSWQSVARRVNNQPVPNTKEIVLDRVAAK